MKTTTTPHAESPVMKDTSYMEQVLECAKKMDDSPEVKEYAK